MMNVMITELEVTGRDIGALADFLERLDQAGQDLSKMIYRAAFVNWRMPDALLDAETVRAHVGDPVVVSLVDLPHLRGTKMSLKLSSSRFLVKEAFCLANLFDLRVVASFDDPATGDVRRVVANAANALESSD